MKKILLVLVGGTICTYAENGVRSLAMSKAQLALIENYRRSNSPFAKETVFEAGARFDTLSENMTVSVWNKLKDYLESCSLTDYDGVLIAHGTDTLAYTASMFAILLAGVKVPVFFVSANAPLDQDIGNGNDNFQAAVECICFGIQPNVYATYRNLCDAKMYIHLGSHLLQCRDYEEDFFSRDMQNIDSMESRKTVSFGDEPVSEKYRKAIFGKHLQRCVLRIEPFVGTDYHAYLYESFKAVLHGTFHSGTVCTKAVNEEESVQVMLERCKEAGVTVYFSPAREEADAEGEIYDSVLAIQGKAQCLYGMTSETAYAKLLIAYSVFREADEIQEFLLDNVNREYR